MTDVPDWLGAKAMPELVAESRPEVLAPDSREYWKNRALVAERALASANRNPSDQGWELDNHRETARRIRDEEIGRMGGGG